MAIPKITPLSPPPQTDPPRSPRATLPTMYDLPSENTTEPGLPDEFHYYQPQLLRETFRPPNYPPERVFIGNDLNLYYNTTTSVSRTGTNARTGLPCWASRGCTTNANCA